MEDKEKKATLEETKKKVTTKKIDSKKDSKTASKINKEKVKKETKKNNKAVKEENKSETNLIVEKKQTVDIPKETTDSDIKETISIQNQIVEDSNIKEEKNKATKEKKTTTFTITEVAILLILTCTISLAMGLFINKPSNKEIVGIENPNIKEFLENYNYILENYYGELDENELIDKAIEGMLEGIDDPYTSYMDQSTSDNFNKQLEGTYQGIGVEISNKTSTDGNTYIYIVNIIKNSPAEKAGLQAGDLITKIDDTDLLNMKTSVLTSYVSNSDNDSFNLEIIRNNETLNFKITRELVTLESVESKMFTNNNQKIGYIYASIFAANTHNQFKEALTSLENENMDSLIIDLRGNSGGHLASVKYMASLFLDSDKIVYQTKSKTETVKTYSIGSKDTDYKIVVLVDRNSASASELLAAALKDNGKAILIGTTTFGKGTVQELIELNDGTQYKFTTKEWLTPLGNSINKIGITPDIVVEFDGSAYNANPTDENDNQLQAAIQELSK